MHDAVVKTVSTIEEFRKKAYGKICEKAHQHLCKEFRDLVKKNKFSLFSTMYSCTQPSRSHTEKKSLDNDVRIFSQLLTATQTRDSDLDTFFNLESSVSPPSLTCDGKIRSGVKADLLPCLKMSVTTESFLVTNSTETQCMHCR